MYVDVVSLLQSNTQDQILLQWEGGDSATMHVLVVHAMIILLTYGPPNGKCMQEMIAVIEEKYTEWPQYRWLFWPYNILIQTFYDKPYWYLILC